MSYFLPQTANVKLQEYSSSDPAENCKFALIVHGDHKLVYRAPDVATQKEWVDNLRGILQKHKSTQQHTMSGSKTWASRDKRRSAVFGQLTNMQASDSDEGITNHPPSTPRQRRNMSRYNTISITRPSLVPNGTEHTAYNDNRPPPRVSRVSRGSPDICTYIHCDM